MFRETHSEFDSTHGLLLKVLQAVILALLDESLHVETHPYGGRLLVGSSHPGSSNVGSTKAKVGVCPAIVVSSRRRCRQPWKQANKPSH
jgi:hypothetical protein